MICNNCGQQNAPGSRICVSCAAPLAAADAKITCPTCKAENSSAERYCIKCGSLMVKAGRPPAPPEPKKPAYTYKTTVRSIDPMPQATVKNAPANKNTAAPATVPAPAEKKPVAEPKIDLFAEPVFTQRDMAEMDALSAILSSKNAVICSYCGAENENADGDCAVCGEPLYKEQKKSAKEEPKPAPKQKTAPAAGKKQLPLHVVVFRKVFGLGKKKDKDANNKKGFDLAGKKFILAAVAALLVVVLIIGIASAGGPKNSFIYDEVDYKLIHSLGSGQAVLFANGKNVSEEPASEEPKTVFYDMYNTCGVYATPVQEGGVVTTAVYYFNKRGASRIINSVNSIIYFAADGSGLLYIDAAAALALYDVKKGESVTIAENGGYISGAFALSPDGEYVMYGYRNESGTNSVCIWHDGTKKEICSSGVPIAVSEGGKKVYYLTVLNNTYDFYVTTYRKPSRFTKIASGIYANAIKFNADLTEVLFTLLDGGTYYSKEGKQAERVASAAMYPLICNEVNVKSCSGLANIYGVGEFFDSFWIGENGLYYVDKGEEPLMLVAGVISYDLSYDGERLVYVDADGRLFIADRKSAAATKSPVAENVTAAAVTGNGEDVYYINSVNALCSVNDKNESVLISQNVDGIMCTEEGVYYKYVSAADAPYALNYCSNAKSGNQIADSVQTFQISDGCAYYITGDGQHMYYSKNGNKSFKQLY